MKITKKELINKIIKELNIDECKFYLQNENKVVILHHCEYGQTDCDNCNGKDGKYIEVGFLLFKDGDILRG